MRAIRAHRSQLTVLTAIIVLTSSLLVLTACDKGKKAVDWVVIHQNRIVVPPATSGNMPTGYNVPTGTEIVGSPEILAIEKDDKIGFANYYINNGKGEAVIVKVSAAVFGVSEFTLDYRKTKVLTVKSPPATIAETLFKFENAVGDHGGPVMVPKK